MGQAYEFLTGTAGTDLLLIADHASNHVPGDIHLGIEARFLEGHIAWDIGVAPLARALNRALGCACILGGVSRLVVDYNREEEADHVIPFASDGHQLPGNLLDAMAREERLARYWHPYHDFIAAQIAQSSPRLLISLHSFTPQLATRPEEQRPWEIGILYNEDDRAARIAIPLLDAQGLTVGDQQPYSGKLLNATMNRHGEANGIAYLGIEMRQDQIGDAAGVARWAALLAPIISATALAIQDGFAS
jgi:predicted N-formylglutamate amidohydrolase